MNFTNKLNLPEPLFRALSSSDYSNNAKYSVSALLKSPRSILLERRHHSEIEADVSESLWRFVGSSIHNFLQKGEGTNDLIEERLYHKLNCGELIGGQADYYEADTKTIYDYKITSIWSLVYKSHYSDWQKQLSIYAFLFRKAGFEVKQIKNIVICRDWNKRDADKVESPINIVEHEILTEIDGKTIEEWINDKVDYIETLESVDDNELPFCDMEFRWAEPDTFKIYWNESKAQNQRSEKNFTGENAEIDANKHCEFLNNRDKDKKKTYRVELVKGDRFKRCEYCSASAFCNQFKGGLC